MLRLTDIRLPIGHSTEELGNAITAVLGVAPHEIKSYQIKRRAVDARKKNRILFVYTVDVDVQSEKCFLEKDVKTNITQAPQAAYKTPLRASAGSLARPVIIGAGPCGLFAGLILAQAGYRPIILERGKAAKDRARDVHAFWRTGSLDPESNVQFGEGGAGTFSDGKLNTQIRDPLGRSEKVIKELIFAGAPDEIAFLNKPHIGTDKLIKVVGNLRREIESLGGSVLMQSRVSNLAIQDGCIKGVNLANGGYIDTKWVILAVGHSARDTFEILRYNGVAMAQKAFSIGLRVEHPQSIIDKAQYGTFAGHNELGAADYKLVHHCANGRTVYSFCMCPGGEVIAASSEAGGVCTNGMSIYSRNRPNANSALLVTVQPQDFGSDDVLAGVEFQRKWERIAFEMGGSDYKAPIQRIEDFLKSRPSTKLGDVVPSYTPGVMPTDLVGCLPEYAVIALRQALPDFDNKIKGFAMPDALLTGVETRSSSPVRITRDENGRSINITGLYPAGEGAGYAGGIVSSAVDGIKAAEAVAIAMNAVI